MGRRFILFSEGRACSALPVNSHPFNFLRGKGKHDLDPISDLNDFQIVDCFRISNQWRKRVPHLGAGGEEKAGETEGQAFHRM